MLTVLTTILGLLLSALLVAAVLGSLIALVYFLAKTRVEEAEQRQRKVLEFEAKSKSALNE